MQAEVQSALPLLRSLAPAALKPMLSSAVAYGTDGDITEAELRSTLAASSLADRDDEFIVTFTGVYFMLRTAVKQHTRLDDVSKPVRSFLLRRFSMQINTTSYFGMRTRVHLLYG